MIKKLNDKQQTSKIGKSYFAITNNYFYNILDVYKNTFNNHNILFEMYLTTPYNLLIYNISF